MTIKNLLRKVGSLFLKKLTKATISKHRPDIVVVTGKGQAGLARETIYQILKNHFPCRRNLETPEAEFSAPLTILGVDQYPDSIASWVKSLVSTSIKLMLSTPYAHKLVLEITDTKPELANQWLKIIQPKVIVICEEIDKKINIPTTAVTFDIIKNLKKPKRPYLKAAKEVGKLFQIKPKEIDRVLDQNDSPYPKINIIPYSKGVIIDSSYNFLPPNLKAVLEVVEKIGHNRLFFTDRHQEIRQIKATRSKVVMIKNGQIPKLELEKETTVVVRTKRPLGNLIIEEISGKVVV